MNKKKILLIVLSLFGVFLVYQAYIFFIAPTTTLQSIYLIPEDAVFIIESDDPVKHWNEVRESKAWQHLNQNEYFFDITEGIQRMDTIFTNQKRILNLFGDRSLLVSFHMYSKKEYGILYTVDLKKIAKLELLKTYMNTLLNNNYSLSRRTYNDKEILEIYSKKTGSTLHLAFIKNQLIASYTHTLIEASIDQYEKPAIGRDLNFIAIKSEVGSTDDVRFYVQYKYLDDYSLTFSDQPTDFIKNLSETFLFSGFKFDLDEKSTLTAKGYTNISENNLGYLQALQRSGKSKRTIPKIAPKRTALYVSYGFEDFETFYENFKILKKQNPEQFKNYDEGVKTIEKFLKINVEKNFVSWIGSEISVLQIQSKIQKGKNDVALVVKANDIRDAKKNLNFILDQIKKRTPVKFKKVTYKDHEIKFMSIKGFFKLILGKLFDDFDEPYYTIIEDFVIFSNQPNTLKSIIDDYVAVETLNTSDDFKNFNASFEDESSVFGYINTPVLYENMYALANESTKVSMQKNKDYIICFPQLGFELIPSENLFESTFVINYQDVEEVKSKTQFKEEKPYKPLIFSHPDDIFKVPAIYPDDLNAKSYTKKYSNGKVRYRVELKNGLKHGKYIEYYTNGEEKLTGRFKNDKQTGTWRYYDSKGELKRKKKF